MSAADVINALQQRGVTLWQEGGALRYRAPIGVLTDRDKAALKAHKTAILAALPPTPVLTPGEPESPPENAPTAALGPRLPVNAAAVNRAAMPQVAAVVDEFRRVFGDGVKCVYAREGDRELGRLPDNWLPTTEEPRP